MTEEALTALLAVLLAVTAVQSFRDMLTEARLRKADPDALCDHCHQARQHIPNMDGWTLRKALTWQFAVATRWPLLWLLAFLRLAGVAAHHDHRCALAP